MPTLSERPSIKRLVAMDVLRGFALLGILLMNIQSFSMPGAAYLNPTAFGDLTGINLAVWLFSHICADQKFLSLFSILFGAGVLLFCDRAAEKGRSVTALHYRRNFWLLLFGLAHGYLFWYGDILYSYAMCAFLVYFLRNKSVKTLLWVAVTLLLINTGYNLLGGLSYELFEPEDAALISKVWSPSQQQLTTEITAYQGSFIQAFSYRAEETLFMQIDVFFGMFVWRVCAMMLLGMALFRSGFFHLEWQSANYIKLLKASTLLGLILIITGLYLHFENDFSLPYSMFVFNLFNYWGSIFIALAYASAIMIVVKAGYLQSLQNRLAAIGKTAFSNYILHTLIFTTIFYGYGFGLYGEVARWQQLLLTVGMWLLQLWLAPIWLKQFRFGPLEWLWRSLTYWQWQSIRR